MSTRALLSVLLYLLTAALLCLSAPRLVAAAPADDALYSRFSELVLSEFAAKGWNCAPASVSTMFAFLADWEGAERAYHEPPTGGASPAVMDFTPILSWEPDFRDDPRYWQLRLACGLDEVHSDNPDGPYHSDFLDRMLAGCADEASWERLPYWGILSSNEELGFRLLDQVGGSYKDNSYWHFQKSLILIDYGEPEAALQQLRAGNSLAPGHRPQPFPYSVLFEPVPDTQNEDDLLVRGVIAAMAMDNIPNYIRMKEEFKNVALMLALGGNPALADELILATRQMGLQDQNSLLDQNAAAVCLSLLPKYAADELLPAPQAQDPVLLELVGFSARFSSALGGGGLGDPVSTAFTGPGTVDTPFRRSFQAASSEIEVGSEVPHARIQKLATIERQDWLNFYWTNLSEQERVRQLRSLFAALPAPPFARLFSQARQEQAP